MNQFLETFLKEWDLYQKQGGTPTVDDCRTSEHAGDFDKPVHTGEIRVFSDSNRQLVGLVYKSWGDEGWIVIPVSDFSVPATEQEILIGSRVFQLWNAFTASAEFTEKSWLVDTLSLDDLQDICAALLHTTIGEPLRGDLASCLGEKITSAEDPRLEYERTFVLNVDAVVSMRENVFVNVGEFLRGSRESWLSKIRNSEEDSMQIRMAASSDDNKTTLWMLESGDNSFEAFSESCSECRFLKPFKSVSSTREPYNICFVATVPEVWKVTPRVDVVARNKTTGELVGEGWLDTSSGEGMIRTIRTEGVVENTHQIVLVAARIKDSNGKV